jgi:hypothetical protein
MEGVEDAAEQLLGDDRDEEQDAADEEAGDEDGVGEVDGEQSSTPSGRAP